ncbi:MAG: Phosphate-binding protein PstS precursor [Syntrophorhabdus sp. PtaU1.Bin058]|nr:MAG: Phosphate-binding protein PstS precursor [Syntrophorhabdus sp. PtaU1.Bin058]
MVIKILSRFLCLLFGIFFFVNPVFCQSTQKELHGEGATFPEPFYQTIFEIYSKQYGVNVYYKGTGSGKGIRQLIDKKVNFAGTDVILNEQELIDAKQPVIHIPTCIGAVVITYNITGNPQLNLTSEVIGDIFLGKITTWNDPDILAINPGVRLSNSPITVIHRIDASGTTYIFSEFLSKTHKVWKQKMGTGKELKWLTGQGARGNPGVAGLMRQIPGSIGYVELIYAIGNQMAVASIKNRSGQFVKPTTKSVSMAANVNLTNIMNPSLTNTPVPGGYPISGFTWIAVYREQDYPENTKEKAEELVKLLWWITHEGQRYTESLHYAPLSKEIIHNTEKSIGSILYKGISIHKRK